VDTWVHRSWTHARPTGPGAARARCQLACREMGSKGADGLPSLICRVRPGFCQEKRGFTCPRSHSCANREHRCRSMLASPGSRLAAGHVNGAGRQAARGCWSPTGWPGSWPSSAGFVRQEDGWFASFVLTSACVFEKTSRVVGACAEHRPSSFAAPFDEVDPPREPTVRRCLNAVLATRRG